MSLARHRSRSHGRLVARRCRRAQPGIDRRWRQRRCAGEEVGMRRRARVPELGEDDTTCPVHGGGDRRPAADLRIGEQSGNVVPADGVATDPRAFGDDQSSRGTLCIVAFVQLRRHQVGIRCAATCQRRHDDAVGELVVTHPVGPQQRLGSIDAVLDRNTHETSASALSLRAWSFRKAARSSTASADSGSPAEM